MKRTLWLAPLLLLVLAGCSKDARIKRAASMLNVKTQTEAQEYEAAESAERKLEIADHHFKTVPKFTQIIDDYLHGREPKGPLPAEVKASLRDGGK